MKESSLKISLSTLTLLSLTAIASIPALANSAPTNNAEPQTQITAVPAQSLPFFARFLEGQESTTTTKPVVLANDTVTTAKYPSDQENGGDVKIPTTKPPQKPDEKLNLTRKYPSDREGNTGERPSRIRDRVQPDIFGNDNLTTNKYPSDNEDDGATKINIPR